MVKKGILVVGLVTGLLPIGHSMEWTEWEALCGLNGKEAVYEEWVEMSSENAQGYSMGEFDEIEELNSLMGFKFEEKDFEKEGE